MSKNSFNTTKYSLSSYYTAENTRVRKYQLMKENNAQLVNIFI